MKMSIIDSVNVVIKFWTLISSDAKNSYYNVIHDMKILVKFLEGRDKVDLDNDIFSEMLSLHYIWF